MTLRFKLTLIGAAVLFVALGALSQTPPAGTIVVNTSIVATAGTGATAVGCIITPVPPTPFAQVNATCGVNGVTFLSADITPLPGGTNGVTFSGNANGNAVTGVFTQATAGAPLGWQVAANSVSKTGTF